MATVLFTNFEYRSIVYSDDHVRRLFNGNGLNQKGLFQYLQSNVFPKQILNMLANFFDLLKNQNFELFQRVFAKTQPTMLKNCNLMQYWENESMQKNILTILNVYFQGRQRSRAE